MKKLGCALFLIIGFVVVCMMVLAVDFDDKGLQDNSQIINQAVDTMADTYQKVDEKLGGEGKGWISLFWSEINTDRGLNMK